MEEIWCLQFYGVCERDAHVEPPCELTMYGTQDANNAWQKLWGEHLRSNGFGLGANNPALYRSEVVNAFCHGNDVVTAAAEDQDRELWKTVARKVRHETNRHEKFSRTLGQRTASVAQICQSDQYELMEIEANQKHVPNVWKILDSSKATLSRLRE